MSSWEGINEFVAVADTHSFTKASQKLSTSVAQVSRRVAALEKRLAVKLLNRTTRKISLTEEGQLYLQQCRALVEGLENADRAVMQMQAIPRGMLKITAPVTYGEQYIAPLITQFLQQHPMVNIELILSNQKLDLIDMGIDVAVRLGQLDNSNLIAKQLGSRQLYVCASREYLSRNGEPHTISELKNHQCLLGSVAHWRFQDKSEEKFFRVSGQLKCNSGFALLDAAKHGLGIVQLPDYYVQEALQTGNLIEVLSAYRVPREGIWALYPESRRLSAKVQLLVRFLSQNLAVKT